MIRLFISMFCFTLLLGLSGCVPHHHHGRPGPPAVRHPGPPPHAPAHGYRHKHHHHGVELVFDTHLGAYVVVGLEDHFFHRDHFYRLAHGFWYRSARLDGHWARVTHSLPPGLAKKRHSHRHKKGKGHPAKRHW